MNAAAMAGSSQDSFDRRTLFWGIAASLFAAAAFFLLSTYAPDFRRAGQGGATIQSRSGAGYAGLARLLALTGQAPVMARTGKALEGAALLIVPVAADTDPQALADLMKRRAYKATLVILPKWQTVPMPGHTGWEMRVARLPTEAVNRLLAPLANARLGTSATRPGQRLTIAGRSMIGVDDPQWIADPAPMVAAAPGKALLGRVAGHPLYILSDPDLLNNAGIKDAARARAMLELIDGLRPNEDPVMIDETLSGGMRGHDLAKLLVEPPFLALTLTIMIAAILAFLHGLARFGPPRQDVRAIAFGKRALIDTTAMLFRRAGRLGGLGDPYAALMRVRAAALLDAPRGLSGEALDHWLDGRTQDSADGFAARIRAAQAATGEANMHAAARSLHQWIARKRNDR